MKHATILLTILLSINLYAYTMDSPPKVSSDPSSSNSGSTILSGTVSPPSFVRQVFEKHQQKIGSRPTSPTQTRKNILLQELINLSVKKETQPLLLQHALTIRKAEKTEADTYDRECFKKVEFWAADSQVQKIAHFWATTNIERLKSLKDLDEYEASALNLRILADGEGWSREHYLEQLLLGWNLCNKLEKNRKDREINDPSLKELNLSPEAAAAVEATAAKGGKFTIGRLKRRSTHGGSGNSSGSPSGQSSPTKDTINQ